MSAPTPVANNITIYTGATFSLKFQMTSGTTPVPVDFTGASASFEIAEKQAQPPVVLITSIGASPKASIALLPDGWVEATITDEETSLIAFKKGFYTINITWSDGTTWRVMQGDVTVSFGA